MANTRRCFFQIAALLEMQRFKMSKEETMKRAAMMVILAVGLLFPFGAYAFECPKHFKATQQAIDKVIQDMKGMGMMAKSEMALVHALLDDAKTWLKSAKHNHNKPQGMYDHARSIAKADAARGHALAADLLHFRYMQKMKK